MNSVLQGEFSFLFPLIPFLMRRTSERQIFRCCRCLFPSASVDQEQRKLAENLSLINECLILWSCQLSILLHCRICFRADPCTCMGWLMLTCSLVPVWAGLSQLWRRIRTFPCKFSAVFLQGVITEHFSPICYALATIILAPIFSYLKDKWNHESCLGFTL